MNRTLALAAFWLLAGAAAAQSPAPQASDAKAPAAAPAATQPPERPAAPRAPLILRLDEIDGPKPTFAPSATEKVQSGNLPSLGGDARTLETGKSLRPSPYPHSTESLQ